MKVTGIIAEFDPFHNGHKYLIEKAREETGSDYIVVVMSGDYVQRGNPAIADKFTRARMAALSGADLVLELPVYYSLGSAEYFAAGAVSILNRLGVINTLAFGSECGSISKICEVSSVLANEPPAYQQLLSDYIKKGLSFPLARQKALNMFVKASEYGYKDTISGINSETIPEASILQDPNNTLGIEYVKMLIRSNSTITPFTIKRTGSSHNDIKNDNNPDGDFCSSSYIRNCIRQEQAPYETNQKLISLERFIPKQNLDLLLNYLKAHENGDSSLSKNISMLLKCRLLMEKDRDFTRYADISSDLSDKINNHIYECNSLEAFAKVLKSRDITYSRLQRILMHIVLDITADNMAEYKEDGYTAYARMLSYNSASSALMSEIKGNSSIPIISTLSDAPKQIDGLSLRLLNEDIRCSELYDVLSGAEATGEYRKRPAII